MREINSFIIEFLEQRGIDTTEEDFNSINFITSGYVDSFSVMSLIMEIEDKYNFKISPEQLSNKDNQSVDALAKLIHEEITKKNTTSENLNS